MSNLYENLCAVRTSMLNIIGQMYIDGRPRNLPALLKSIGDELNGHVDFLEEFLDMSLDELEDLGFSYINDEEEFMLIPAWLFPIIPEGVELIDINGEVFTLEDDTPISLYGDSWIDAGFYFSVIDIKPKI